MKNDVKHFLEQNHSLLPPDLKYLERNYWWDSLWRIDGNVRQSDGQGVNKEADQQGATQEFQFLTHLINYLSYFPERRKRNRTNSSNLAAKEINLATILICTTFTFILLHTPRWKHIYKSPLISRVFIILLIDEVEWQKVMGLSDSIVTKIVLLIHLVIIIRNSKILRPFQPDFSINSSWIF